MNNTLFTQQTKDIAENVPANGLVYNSDLNNLIHHYKEELGDKIHHIDNTHWTTKEKNLFKFFSNQMKDHMKKVEIFKFFSKISGRTPNAIAYQFYTNKDFYMKKDTTGITKETKKMSLSPTSHLKTNNEQEGNDTHTKPEKSTSIVQLDKKKEDTILEDVQTVFSNFSQLETTELSGLFSELAKVSDSLIEKEETANELKKTKQQLKEKDDEIDALNKQIAEIKDIITTYDAGGSIHKITELPQFIEDLKKKASH